MSPSNLPFLALLFLTVSIAFSQAETGEFISIVPKPVKLIRDKGSFLFNEKTAIVFDKDNAELDSVADHLAAQLHNVTGYPVPVSAKSSTKGSIVLLVDSNRKNLGKEGYELTVTPTQIKITGADGAGVFYGTQTLYQLLPPEVESEKTVYNVKWSMPCVRIEDFPRFPWRGMHLDVGRHFFPVKFIKRYLDLMAMYKLNTFHWHLTEDQGWRIEIKKYPLLTKVGSWRKESMGDGVPHGGFYTQDEIRDVVAYAKARHIEIVPEIEMPGHARAALASYPEYSCVGAPLDVGTVWGVEKEVYCAGNERTYEFLANILSEVFGLFPGKYIHIGGDECPKARWKECPRCQARMKAEGLKNEEELQSYFVKRIEKFINSNGKWVIGWDEILEGGLAPNASVMSWRGTQGGIDAAKSGHDVVMTPTSNCYFDYLQSLTGEPNAIGGYLPMDSVYNYEPVPTEFTADEAKHVLGSQGNMWTEYMPDSKTAEYMLMPRMCALSEMVWTQKDLRNYDDFQKRMESQYDRLSIMNVNFRVPTPFTLGGNVASFADSTLTFNILPGAKAYYTLDGEEPTRDALLYTEPVRLKNSVILKAKTFLPNGKKSNTVIVNFSKLDSAVNGLTYVSSEPQPGKKVEPGNSVEGKSGVTNFVTLPENPPIPGQFAVRFAGFLAIEKEGLYTFYLRADSGSILSVNNAQLINGGPPDARWWRSGKIALKEGKYPISVLDLELDQWRGVALEYEGPGIDRQSIPARLFNRK